MTQAKTVTKQKKKLSRMEMIEKKYGPETKIYLDEDVDSYFKKIGLPSFGKLLKTIMNHNENTQ